MPERVLAVLAAGALVVALLSLPPDNAADPAPATAAGPAAAPRVPLPSAAAAAPHAAGPSAVPEVAEVAVPDDVPAPASRQAPAGGPAPGAGPSEPLPHRVQQRVDEALRTLGYPWQELGWTLRFEPYRGGLLGLADPATRTITVYVKSRSSVQELRVVLAHEVGHALDDRFPEQRAAYRELRGIPVDLPWFPCSGCEDYDSPAGDFAEVFAAWLVGPTDFRSRVAPLPDDAQLREVGPLFAPPSARVGPPPERVQPAPGRSASPSPSPPRRPLLHLGQRT